MIPSVVDRGVKMIANNERFMRVLQEADSAVARVAARRLANAPAMTRDLCRLAAGSVQIGDLRPLAVVITFKIVDRRNVRDNLDARSGLGGLTAGTADRRLPFFVVGHSLSGPNFQRVT